MAKLFRVGELRPYRGKFFACATKGAAEKWAVDLKRERTSIIEIEVSDETPCVVNTHGYVEADWYSVLDPAPWSVKDDRQIERCKIFRQEMSIFEAIEILRLLGSEEEYQAHEIVWEAS